MKLYNAWYCPYAQRVWMTLIHKAVDFDCIEVDPYYKTDWWVRVSRGAELVPVVVQENPGGVGETTIVESTRILEFLDDYRPDAAPIFAREPLRRAEQRYWMDHIDKRITPYFYRFLRVSEPGEKRDQSRQQMIDGLTALVKAMDADGPGFSGASVDAVDIALIPFAYRIEVLLRAYRDFELPRGGAIWQRYQRWYQAMLAQPAFRATAFDHDDYQSRLVEHYLPYSCGEVRTDVTSAD